MFCMQVYLCNAAFPGTGVNRQLYAAMWVLGIKPKSSGRAASALSHGAISPASQDMNIFKIYNILRRQRNIEMSSFYS